MDEQMEQRLLAIEAVISALAKREGADPAFSGQVTMALVELTDGRSAMFASRTNALARRLTGEM